MNKIYLYTGKHEQKKHIIGRNEVLTKDLGAVLGYEYGGIIKHFNEVKDSDYVTISSPVIEKELGVPVRIKKFLGGVVKYPFQSNKSITHGLVPNALVTPEGWDPRFAEAIKEVKLPGYSCFSKEDVRTACELLWSEGYVPRGKDPRFASAEEQYVLETKKDLNSLLDKLNSEELLTYGYVVEINLEEVTVTYNVGKLRLGEEQVSYYGPQRMIDDIHGNELYGGSAMTVARGTYEDLIRYADLPSNVIEAINQAKVYDDAHKYLEGCNILRSCTDVIQGYDNKGEYWSAVLEQSYRLGGCSASTINGIRAFKESKDINLVASTLEINYYSKKEDAPVNKNKQVIYEGVDPLRGYVVIDLDPHPVSQETSSVKADVSQEDLEESSNE